jgi:hypothetical protein
MLKPDVWYQIRTAINNRETLFRSGQAPSLFAGVLDEATHRFVFEIRGLHLAGDLLSFYIKPADGFELPDILKWIKQTFAVRYNRLTGRTGHIWGDRYWSLILEEEPAERAGKGREREAELGAGEEGVRPLLVEMAIITGFFPFFPHSHPVPPP